MRNKEQGNGKQGKKLSWSYRNKKRVNKAQQVDKKDSDVQVQNKKGRIIVRNLSFKATEEDIRSLYDTYGQIEEINLLRHPDGRPVGCCFVQFKRVEDASKAIFQTNRREFLGRVIRSDWAIEKSKYVDKLKTEGEDSSEKKTATDGEPGDTDETNEKKKQKKKKALNERRAEKLKRKKKRARIVVRNLSFKVTEDHLREMFSEYGNIEEIKLLTRPDGKSLGCGFIQYELVQSAAKALHYTNLKPLLGRNIVVDWAVAKNKFANEQEKETEVVEIKEEESDGEDKPKEVSLENGESKVQLTNESDVESIKEEIESTDSEDDDVSVKSEALSSEDDKSIKEEEDDADDDENEEKYDDSSRPKVISNDVSEGRTVFLKNVPFSAKNEDLKECMEQFGPIYYALICMDPLTEHSKGTAFVKFRNAEDAEKCLSAGTELRLHNQVLDPHKALHRNEVQDKKSLKNAKVKDSRNLYLVKEGVILAGSPAAAGLSASDMARRLQLEQWKSQMLRNLNMFVSRNRLVVQNLPPTVDDAKLRQLFKNHSGPKAMITEARVMRDLRNLDAKGVGKSKEFGFVTFTTHEDALAALRSINNNPNIFTKHKRPIVAFSIENRVMLNAKQKRIEKSRERNSQVAGKRKNMENGDKEGEPKSKKRKFQKSNEDVENHSFSGITSKPGVNKIRSRFNLKSQAILHTKTLKKEKKKIKHARKEQMKKKEEIVSRNEAKPKQGSKKMSKEDANFENIVSRYKSKLSKESKVKSKWYET